MQMRISSSVLIDFGRSNGRPERIRKKEKGKKENEKEKEREKKKK